MSFIHPSMSCSALILKCLRCMLCAACSQQASSAARLCASGMRLIPGWYYNTTAGCGAAALHGSKRTRTCTSRVMLAALWTALHCTDNCLQGTQDGDSDDGNAGTVVVCTGRDSRNPNARTLTGDSYDSAARASAVELAGMSFISVVNGAYIAAALTAFARRRVQRHAYASARRTARTAHLERESKGLATRPTWWWEVGYCCHPACTVLD